MAVINMCPGASTSASFTTNIVNIKKKKPITVKIVGGLNPFY